MRKIVALLLALTMVFALCGCGGEKESVKDTKDKIIDEFVEEEPNVTQNNYFALDAICVDDSYHYDNEVLRKVYLFFTLTAKETNLETDSKYIYLKINDMNEYESYLTITEKTLFQSYYHSQYIEHVYMGQTLKVFTTFEIPEADLAPGRKITIRDNHIPQIEEITFSTDLIQHFNSPEEMAMAVDSEGYEKLQQMREEADAETTAKVYEQIVNKKFFSYSTSSGINVSVTFRADDRCEIALGPMSNGASYSIRKGFIFIYPDANTDTVYEISYTLDENGVISMDVAEMIGM